MFFKGGAKLSEVKTRAWLPNRFRRAGITIARNLKTASKETEVRMCWTEELLEKKGVKPTAIRLLVLKALSEQEEPVSLSELETCLETVDKSTLFRSLSLFLEHHVVHAFEDGNGVLKYELCRNPEGCSVQDMHVHFYCTRCHRTYCLPTRIPSIDLPEGFALEAVNFMLKGICPRCQAD